MGSLVARPLRGSANFDGIRDRMFSRKPLLGKKSKKDSLVSCWELLLNWPGSSLRINTDNVLYSCPDRMLMPSVTYLRLDGSVPAGQRHGIVNKWETSFVSRIFLFWPCEVHTHENSLSVEGSTMILRSTYCCWRHTSAAWAWISLEPTRWYSLNTTGIQWRICRWCAETLRFPNVTRAELPRVLCSPYFLRNFQVLKQFVDPASATHRNVWSALL